MYGGGKTAFSHKRHAPLNLPCAYCHAQAKTSERAGLPGEAVCRSCHPNEAVARFPTTRVYQVRDMVFFSHEKHSRVECAECHGAMYEQDVVTKPFRATSMKACVECHKERRATLACSACHELGQ